MKTLLPKISLPAFLALMLAGCGGGPVQTYSGSQPDPAEASVAVAAEDTTEDWEANFQRQRIIGDLLYDALRALDEDRLLTPVDDNAHGRYQRVLALAPGHPLAVEGLKNIVARYLELATEASRQGRFDDGLTYLGRARFVDPEDPAITEAWLVLQAEINSKDQVYRLDPAALAARSAALQDQLGDIARQARQDNAFFLITAPTDDQARWIFSIMRAAVDGYRLRGNIEIGSSAIIRLRKSANEDS